MKKRGKQLITGKKGIMRLVEVFLAISISLSAFIVSYYLMKPPNPFEIRERGDLEKTGYSLIHTLAEKELFDNVMFENGELADSPYWEQQLAVVINSLMPPGIFFNMSIYNLTQEGDWVKIERLNQVPISNTASQDAFIKSGEAIEISCIYTCTKFWVLKIHLVLAKPTGK